MSIINEVTESIMKKDVMKDAAKRRLLAGVNKLPEPKVEKISEDQGIPKYTIAFKRPFGSINEGSGTPLTWGLSRFLGSLEEWIVEQSNFQEKVKKSVKNEGGAKKIVSKIKQYAENDDVKKAKNLLMKIGYLGTGHSIEFTVSSSDPSGEIVVSHHIPPESDLKETKECNCGCDVCKKKNGKRTYEKNMREDVAILTAVREACIEDHGCIVEVFDSKGNIKARFGDTSGMQKMFAIQMGMSWVRFLAECRDHIKEDEDLLLRRCIVDLTESSILLAQASGKIHNCSTELTQIAHGDLASASRFTEVCHGDNEQPRQDISFFQSGSGKIGAIQVSFNEQFASPITYRLKKMTEGIGIPHQIAKKIFNRGVASWFEGSPHQTPIESGYQRVASFIEGDSLEESDKALYDRWV